MADNVPITAGTGTSIATDDVGGVHYQRMKLHTSEDASAEPIGDTDHGSSRALWVDNRPQVVRLSATPTVSTSPAYTAKDAVGALMTFSNAARVSGGKIIVRACQVVDKDQEQKDYDLVLFDRSITAPTDNAVFDPTDTELTQCVGVIPVGGWADFNDNSVFHAPCNVEAVLNGTDLFGVLVSRSSTGPTFTATTDIVVTLTVEQL